MLVVIDYLEQPTVSARCGAIALVLRYQGSLLLCHKQLCPKGLFPYLHFILDFR
jgi:hypothetical protein